MLDIDKSKRAPKHVVCNGRGDEIGGVSRISLKKRELLEINRLIETEGLQLNRGRRRALKSLSKKVKH
ncbi:MAG: hypothetical protein QX191_07630 [Methylococcaceae bacterium]